MTREKVVHLLRTGRVTFFSENLVSIKREYQMFPSDPEQLYFLTLQRDGHRTNLLFKTKISPFRYVTTPFQN